MSRIEFYDYFTEESTRDKMENKFKSALNQELHAPVNPSDFHYFAQLDEPIYDTLKGSLDGNLGKDEYDKTKIVSDAYSASMAGFTSWLKKQIRKIDGSHDDATQDPDQMPPERQGGSLRSNNTLITIQDKYIISADADLFKPYIINGKRVNAGDDVSMASIETGDQQIPEDVRKTAVLYLSDDDAKRLGTPTTSATTTSADSSTTSADTPIRVGGTLKNHTLIVIPVDKVDIADKESFAPYSDGKTVTVDAKDVDIQAYVRKNAYSYLSAEEITKLTKSLENVANKQPRQTDATGTMEEPTAEDKANASKNIHASRQTTESVDFDDFYFTELMPWTNKAKEQKHLKLADKYSNKEKAAKAILDAEDGKVSAVRVYKMKSGGKLYLLTMVNKDGRDMYYVAANTSGLKSIQKATMRSLDNIINVNHGSLGKEFSGGSAGKNKQTFSATIPKVNTQSLNSDEAIAKNLKLGTNWQRYVIKVSDEKYGDGKQFGTKQSGYIYVFPNTTHGIVVVTDSSDKLKMVVRNEDLTRYNTQDGNVITTADKVVIKAPDAKPITDPQVGTSATQNSVVTSANDTNNTGGAITSASTSATQNSVVTSANNTSGSVKTSATQNPVVTSAKTSATNSDIRSGGVMNPSGDEITIYKKDIRKPDINLFAPFMKSRKLGVGKEVVDYAIVNRNKLSTLDVWDAARLYLSQEDRDKLDDIDSKNKSLSTPKNADLSATQNSVNISTIKKEFHSAKDAYEKAPADKKADAKRKYDDAKNAYINISFDDEKARNTAKQMDLSQKDIDYLDAMADMTNSNPPFDREDASKADAKHVDNIMDVLKARNSAKDEYDNAPADQKATAKTKLDAAEQAYDDVLLNSPDDSKTDEEPTEDIDWAKYDYLIGNSPDGAGMVILVDTDAIATLEDARKKTSTGAKYFADAVLGNKKKKDYAEKTITLGDKLFYKFGGNFDRLGTGDGSDPIEILKGMGYSSEDLEYPLPSGNSARITGFYKNKIKQEETFAEYRERMLNEINQKKSVSRIYPI